MADNISVTEGSGKTVATDEVTDGTLGTVQVQMVKLMDGTIGGTDKVKVVGASTAATTSDPALVVAISPNGDVSHDDVDSGAPAKIGYKAVNHGSDPTPVSNGDRTDAYANRAGIPFFMGGHPNIVTRSATLLEGYGATDQSLLSVGANTRIVITQISAKTAASNTGNVSLRVGFAASTLPVYDEFGVDGMLIEGEFDAGQGHQVGNGAGIVGIGGAAEDLRLTCSDPTGGAVYVTFSYYTIVEA